MQRIQATAKQRSTLTEAARQTTTRQHVGRCGLVLLLPRRRRRAGT
jgi:hypothetical protein